MQVMHYDDAMRTTVSIDDHLLVAAKRRARERGQTLGQVVDDALRRELADGPAPAAAPLPVFRGSGGLQPHVDPTSNRSLHAALDEGRRVERLR